MNHSASFQEDYTDLFVKDVDAYSNLEEAILEHQPEQIFEPGTMVAYSNWSTALAAYVVEKVSGMDYVEYVHANIFEPLGMEHSAIAMDLSDNEWVAEKRKELMSYDIAGNKLEEFVKLAMLGVFILTFMTSLIIIVVRGIREIVKKLKRDVRIRTACGTSLFFYSASVCRLLIITIFLPSPQYLFSVFCRRKSGHLPELP